MPNPQFSPASRRKDQGSGEPPSSCPAGRAVELIAHKWTIHILFALHEAGGPTRFRELQRRVSPITQKELTKRLRELEKSGLVGRRVYAEVPPRVEYRLTELGATLLPALTGLHEWAERHGAAIEEHRRRTAETAGPPGEASCAAHEASVD